MLALFFTDQKERRACSSELVEHAAPNEHAATSWRLVQTTARRTQSEARARA
jgi:hypothetical protein